MAHQLNDDPDAELDIPTIAEIISTEGYVDKNKAKGKHRLFYEGEARRANVIKLVSEGYSLPDALKHPSVGVSMNAYKKWRVNNKKFAVAMDIARAGVQGIVKDWNGTHAGFAVRYFGMGYAKHQLEFIEELERLPLGNILMTLWPPEHGKTTTFENYASEKIAVDPNYRITVASENQPIARKIIGRIKHRMEPDGPFPKYVSEFGPFKPVTGQAKDDKQAQPWGADYFNVAKKKHSDERDYTMQALGWNSSIVSTRCDHLHADDMQSTKTLNQTDRIETWFRQDALSRPGEWGRTTIAGTRVGPDDIYSRLADDTALDGILKVLRFPAIRTNIETGEQEALWPERYNLEQLERMKRKVGEEAWDRNYMQNPGASEQGRTFTDEAIGEALNPNYSLHHTIPTGNIAYVTLDPALGGKNCVMTLEVVPEGKLIVRQIRESEGLRQNEQIMQELNASVRWVTLSGAHVSDVVIETMNFQKGLANDERLVDMQRHYGFAMRPHLTGNNKYDENIGIASMVGSFLRGEIILPWAEDDLTRFEIGELVRQLRAWKPGARGNKLRQDRVMALWFGWILWRNRYKRPIDAMTNTDQWKRQGVPWGGTRTGLVLPQGALR